MLILPWVAAIELLAKICDQTAKLSEHKVDGLLVCVIDPLDVTRYVDRRLLDLFR